MYSITEKKLLQQSNNHAQIFVKKGVFTIKAYCMTCTNSVYCCIILLGTMEYGVVAAHRPLTPMV